MAQLGEALRTLAELYNDYAVRWPPDVRCSPVLIPVPPRAGPHKEDVVC